MVLGNIGKSINNSLKKLFKQTILDDMAIKELIKDMQRTLLVSDVDVSLVMNITKDIETILLDKKPIKGISKKDYIVKVLWDILTKYLGGKAVPLKLDLGTPNLVMFIGIQGSGKTTTIGKLARFYQKKGVKTGVICADNFRPGAYDQLKQLVSKFDIPFYGDKEEKDATVLSKDGYEKMKSLGVELILLDTSGRHSEETSLMEEMQAISKTVESKEIILVIDGTIGQQAKKQARAFQKATDIGSIIITKLDGSSKGGGALSAVAETKTPIKFIGVGEGMNDIEVFNPKQFVGNLLGIPDLKGLLLKVKDAEISIDEDAQKRMQKGKLTLYDMMEQIKEVQKIGSFGSIAGMLGLKHKISEADIEVSKERFKQWEVIMGSMTKEEIKNPKLIKLSSKKRIAAGAGVPIESVSELLKQHKQMQITTKRMYKKQRR